MIRACVCVDPEYPERLLAMHDFVCRRRGILPVYFKSSSVQAFDHGGLMDSWAELEEAQDDDVLLYLDADALPLDGKAAEHLVEKARERGVAGIRQNANHIEGSPDYAGPAVLAVKAGIARSASARADGSGDVAAKWSKIAGDPFLIDPVRCGEARWGNRNGTKFGLDTLYAGWRHLFCGRRDPALAARLEDALAEEGGKSAHVAFVIATTLERKDDLNRAVSSAMAQRFDGRIDTWIVGDGVGVQLNPEALAEGPFREIRDEPARPWEAERHIFTWMTPIQTGRDGFYGHRVYCAMAHQIDYDFLCLLDDDNWCDHNHVAALCDALLRNPAASGAYCERWFVRGDKRIADTFENGVQFVDTSCWMIRRCAAISRIHNLHGRWGADRVFSEAMGFGSMRPDASVPTGKRTLFYEVGDHHPFAAALDWEAAGA